MNRRLETFFPRMPPTLPFSFRLKRPSWKSARLWRLETLKDRHCVSSLAGVVEEYAKIRNRIAENGWFFEDSFIELKRRPKSLRKTLFFRSPCVLPLEGKPPNRFEGILARWTQYTVILGELDALTDQILRSFWQSALSEAEAGRYDLCFRLLISVLIARSALRMDGPGRLFAYRDDTCGKAGPAQKNRGARLRRKRDARARNTQLLSGDLNRWFRRGFAVRHDGVSRGRKNIS